MEGDDAAALDAWPQRVRSVVPLGGGWNSGTWSVESEQGRFVAKLVDDHAEDLGVASRR